ncbi:porin family protein [Arenicella xantha]|uniref:Outer membrane protein with beta-barrel domain n=1 Tax=Arenicella xantha TaxID=644221 RepID=A0A395JMS7_9GAMM|nr:porin family protein [Arenicella xantha]RBP52777.1 outer membrane protein with beta-barrel domain [Arenicella xantha]
MNTNKKTLGKLSNLALATTLAMSAAVPTIASADDDSGFYIGANYNDVDIDYLAGDLVKLSDSDQTQGIRLGYMFNDAFGVDLGYTDLGTYRATDVGLISASRYEAEVATLAFVINFSPLDKLDLYARAGAARVETERTLQVLGIEASQGAQTNTAPFGALGAELDFGGFNLFGEYSRLDSDDYETEAELVTVGVKFEFGS